MKTAFVVTAFIASALARSFNLAVAKSEFRQLNDRFVAAKDGHFVVTKDIAPGEFKGGNGELKLSPGKKVYAGPTGHIGYFTGSSKAPKGFVIKGCSKTPADGEVHWTKGAVFACPNVSFNIGTPTEYQLFANHEGTPTGQADNCFNIHLSIEETK
ncbi:uncharacterized protein BKA55DRAFT_692388 [Fusarium redolens]|uniref:Uncharacterized protein n=1 Tax=Fusarium redolens TaxID=48865 RepID=A0A9P9GSQ7_FUSRE|nr:uncharacterized protein BKA55DRAFT_692388 [Fusarium redolens]KAH7244591.1 hypothetical protein BKA55DRAFT_692388 [Fusarium redolens]